MRSFEFGKTKKGEAVTAYEITNANGMKAVVLNYGAILQSLIVPNGEGGFKDVVLGYDNVAQYEVNPPFFGATIGPSANRICDASFTIDGVAYKVDVNDGPNNLHSHIENGIHKRIWNVTEVKDGVKLSIGSADMDMGFPGNKMISITYTLDDKNGIKLAYEVTSDKNTIVNMTNHSYFNLDGQDAGTTIENHALTLNASKYTPVVKGAIPTGEIADVKGTVMDFTNGRVIGDDINDSFEQLVLTGGYDHNYVIDGADGSLKLIAKATSPASKVAMEVYTDLPGVQFYAGNFVGSQTGKNGAHYDKRFGFCLETQFYPDTINHANFPSCVFGPGKPYKYETVYRFV